MKIKKKIKKKSGSKTEILRNLEAQPKRLVSYKKKVYILCFEIELSPSSLTQSRQFPSKCLARDPLYSIV